MPTPTSWMRQDATQDDGPNLTPMAEPCPGSISTANGSGTGATSAAMVVSARKVDTTAASCTEPGPGIEPAGCSSRGAPSTKAPRTAPGNDGTPRATTWTPPGGSR